MKSVQPRSVVPAIATLPARIADTASSHMVPLERVQSDAVSDERSTTNLLGIFALLGLLLAVIGVHGAVAQRVNQRTRELGIRLAFGATAGQLIRMILIETVAIAVIGIGAGVVGATALARFLQSLLFGVTSHDLITFAVSSLALLVAAVTAALIPALGVSHLDPAITLRQD